MRLTTLVATVALLVPSTGTAQARARLAFDAGFGFSYGHGGEFHNRDVGNARLALGIRGDSRFSPYADLAMDWIAISKGDDLLCAPNPRGGCKSDFPEFSGPSLSGGVIARPRKWVELRGGIGIAAYAAGGSRVGAALSSVDGALFPLDRLGVVVGTRLIIVPRYHHDRLWSNPWMVGVRIR